jgi:hypothetical protein
MPIGQKIKSRYMEPHKGEKNQELHNSVDKKRGSSFKSPSNAYRSIEHSDFGMKSLEKKKMSMEKNVQLPMIPKGKKKKL